MVAVVVLVSVKAAALAKVKAVASLAAKIVPHAVVMATGNAHATAKALRVM